MPTWSELNETLLTVVRALAAEALPPALSADLQLLTSGVHVPSLSDELVSTFAGDSYFHILRFVDGIAPNSSHYALADLAGDGILRALVSTNFDTLIERAFAQRGVELIVLAHPDEFVEAADRDDDTCILIKVHGSADRPETIIDTLTQKRLGVQPAVRQRISRLLGRYHLLVLGFSGADLEFADDYFSAAPAGTDWHGLTWVLHPGATAGPAVLKALARAARSPEASRTGAGSGLLMLTLPDLFADLGRPVSDPPGEGDGRQDPSAVRERLEEGVRRWLSGPRYGGTLCAALCANLLGKSGRFVESRAIRAYLAEAIDGDWTDGRLELEPALDRLMQTAVCRALAMGAGQDGAFDEMLRWCQREVTVYQPILTMVGRMFSSAQLNIGRALIATGEPDRAIGIFREVFSTAIDPAHQAGAAINLALLLGDSDEALTLASGAREIAPHSARTQTDAFTIEASIFLSRGDYVAAATAIADGLNIAGLSGDRVRQANFRLFEARRLMLLHSVAAAKDALRRLLEDLEADAAIAASVRIEVIREFDHGEYADVVNDSRRWLEDHLAGYPDDDPRVVRYRALDRT